MNDKIVLDFGSIVSQMESEGLRLLTVKDNNTLFVVDDKDNLYAIEPYYAGGYLDRFIGERNVVSFELVEQPVINFEDWRKKFLDAAWVKDFIERTVKIEYPDFEKTSPLHVIRSKPFMDRAGVEQQHLYDFWFQNAKSIDMPIWEFMGMGSAEYEQWQRGELKLRDGSYHEMEASFFRISESVAALIRPEIASKEMLEQNILFSAFLHNLMPDKLCSGYLSATCDWAMIYDPGDDLIAIVSMDEIMHKEDFASMMKAFGVEATEANFDKVWDVFIANKDPQKSLRDNAYAAVESLSEIHYGIDDNWLHSGQKVTLLNPHFKGQVGTVQSFAWNTGEYVVTLESGHDVLFRPSELEKIEDIKPSLSEQIQSASSRSNNYSKKSHGVMKERAMTAIREGYGEFRLYDNKDLVGIDLTHGGGQVKVNGVLYQLQRPLSMQDCMKLDAITNRPKRHKVDDYFPHRDSYR